jgi:hypothetical protein
MSKEIRSNGGGDKDINRISNENGERKSYEGFEGMNYEQIRQPYNPNYIRRNRSNDERKEPTRPDEG